MSQWWGPWFPDAASGHWFGPWFGDGVPSATLIPGVGPPGVATFALDLDVGATMTFSWATEIEKMYSGGEFRAAPLDTPKLKIQGTVLLPGPLTRAMRARLERYAAIGAEFLLALPYEAITITAPAAGAVIPTTSTLNLDWMVRGQRVVVMDADGNSLGGVIQDFVAGSITLDVAPDASLDAVGNLIAPCIAVYLDPQQPFSRYRIDGVERWQINATCATFGFQEDARAAFAALSSSSGALHDAVISYVDVGTLGNLFTISFVNDGVGAGSVSAVGFVYTYHYEAGVTTVANVLAGLGGVFTFAGSFDPTATLTAGDAIGPISLNFGSAKSWGVMGAGGPIETFSGEPVWNRGLEIGDTVNDSIQSLSELVDLGGMPISIGTADEADWGRGVSIKRNDRDEWQWLKAFLDDVRGSQRSFRLPTWRPDLLFVAFGGVDPISGNLYFNVESGESAGDFFAWYPDRCTELQIRQTDGAINYATINNAIDNNDGTISLSLTYSGALTGADIELVSWLERCRFESPDFEITWTAGTFELGEQARTVAQ